MSREFANSAPESLLVVRLGAMGDVIHTLSAISALRAAFPDLRIGWAIEERWSELLCASGASRSGPRDRARPLIDSVHVVDTKKWRRSLLSFATRRQIFARIREIRGQKYDVAADFQGAIKSALLASFAGARVVAGMSKPREAPAKLLYHRRVDVNGTHVIDHYRSLAEAIAGKTLLPTKAEFPRDEKAEASIVHKLGIADKNLVLINPGAGWGAKQWPAERYGDVAKALAQEGLKPLINFGPREEQLASAIQTASGGTAIPLSCSIAELIALTRRVRLFIGGDTGPLHLAAALGVPVVAIYGPTDPARNGPCGTKCVVLRNPASQNSLSHTNAPDPGLQRITAAEVTSAAHQLLENSSA